MIRDFTGPSHLIAFQIKTVCSCLAKQFLHQKKNKSEKQKHCLHFLLCTRKRNSAVMKLSVQVMLQKTALHQGHGYGTAWVTC